MRVIQTATLDASTLDDDARLHVYNGLDCCITTEVFAALASKVPEAGFAYNVERALQATAFALMRRGIKVDMEERGLQAAALRARLEAALRIWNRLTRESFDLEVNPASPTQLLKFFYAVMGLRPVNVFNKQTKDYGPSTSREALEKLEEQWRAKPFVSLLLEMRSIGKQLEVLSKGVRDGRMHCSFHPAGTLSGRWASSEDPFGSGGNAQNISDEMRGVFVADEGYKLCYMDLKQAEALCVAYLALPWGDSYLKACLSGDPHTAVAKMLWPQLKSKADAQQPFYRHFSFRDMAKRGTHLSNYGGKPAIMVKHLKIELAVAEKFQALLFSSFPEIRQWQANVAARLVRDRSITTALGRKCWFPGRPWDPEVIKRAIAYEPQSLVADTLNRGMYRVWKKYDERFGGPIQLLLQVHDAILFQYPEALEATLLPAIAADLVVPFEVNGQTCAIGVDSHVGWNWGHRIDKADGTAKNPYGLVEWKGHDERHSPPKRSLLDRPANSFVQLAQLPCNLPSLVGYRHH